MRNQKLVSDIENFCNFIDMEYQIDFLQKYEKIGDSEYYGGKHSGSNAEQEGAKFIAEKMREIGLEKVELVPIPTSKFQFNDAEIIVLSKVSNGQKMRIKPYAYMAPGTSPEGISAALVDVGKSYEEFYQSNKIEGKIALIEAMGVLEGAVLTAQLHEAILHGAAAIFVYAVEDILNENTIRIQPPNIASPIPIVGISLAHAKYLQNLLQECNDNELRLNLKVDVNLVPDQGISYNVVGELRGELTEERIFYSSHLDHFFRCLQDNMSSCATLLGIAKAMIEAGYRPNRTITFVMHGSHECGLLDSRYSYISGSYKMLHGVKTEWHGKGIADINFEYTALKLDELSVITSIGNEASFMSFLEYAPSITNGFNTVQTNVQINNYYLLSWTDAISYLAEGVPVYLNDAITMQLNTGHSPYVGRDHSNYDNWDIFDEGVMESIARFYGGLGIYLDSIPFCDLNFVTQVERMKSVTNFKLIERLQGNVGSLQKVLGELNDIASDVFKKVNEKNSEYHLKMSKEPSLAEKKSIFKEAEKINQILLKAFFVLTQLEKIGPSDFLCIGNEKYTRNIERMQSAMDRLKSGNAKEALTEDLLRIDLATVSYYFSEEVVTHIQKQICDDSYKEKRTWASRKELSCLTLFRLIQKLKSGMNTFNEDYSEEIKILEVEMIGEQKKLLAVVQQEELKLKMAVDILNEAMKMLEFIYIF